MTQLVVIDVRNPISWLVHKFSDRQHVGSAEIGIDPDLQPAMVREEIENYRAAPTPSTTLN